MIPGVGGRRLLWMIQPQLCSLPDLLLRLRMRLRMLRNQLHGPPTAQEMIPTWNGTVVGDCDLRYAEFLVHCSWPLWSCHGPSPAPQ